MPASAATKLLLAFRSGDRCAFPDCDRSLTVDGDASDSKVTGAAAHIAAENPRGPRFDATIPLDKRNSYSNLIYLCQDCHERIDKQVEDFPPVRLHELKRAHENRVQQAITNAFADVGFPELEEATRWITKIGPGGAGHGFALVPPEDKLQKNGLGPATRSLVQMGLSVARDVQAYIEDVTAIDSDFPDRLKSGFLTEYYRLRHEGHVGDDLYDLMCRFAQRGFPDPSRKAAGMAVLAYLFEICDVFEK